MTQKRSRLLENDQFSSTNYWKDLKHNEHGYATEEGDKKNNFRREMQSDTVSLLTHSSWSQEKKGSKTSCGLICILFIGALIIILGTALLTYFLLSSRDQNRKEGTREAYMSVRFLNKTYSPEMDDNTSQAFQEIAVQFCDEIERYFLKNFPKSYNSCKVIELKNVANRDECTCEIKDGYGLMEAAFKLTFDEHPKDVTKRNLIDTIWSGTNKEHLANVVYYKIKDYLIDIRVLWEPTKGGVLAELNIPVYNLTYTQDLEYKNTTTYQHHAKLFCNDLNTSFKNSWLKERYIGCEVKKYNVQPTSVNIILQFKGNRLHDLQKSLIHIVMSRAKTIPFGNVNLKIIGDLLVSPYDTEFKLKPITEITPIPSTTTTPTTINGISQINMMYKLFNFTTFSKSLPDHMKHEACKKIQHFLKDNPMLNYLYLGCNLQLRNRSFVEVRITYGTPFHEDLYEATRTTLERNAPTVEYWPYELMRLHDLYLIKDYIYVLTTSSVIQMTTVTSIASTPVIASSTKRIFIYDTTVARSTYKLYNFTYAPKLAANYTVTLKDLEGKFCADVDKFFQSSFLFLIYQKCQIRRFSSNLTNIEFDLFFYAELSDKLKNDINYILDTYSPHQTFYSKDLDYFDVLDIGDLFLIKMNRSFIFLPSNWTKTSDMFSTKVITLSEFLPHQESAIDYVRKAKISMGYKLYQFPFVKELFNPDSQNFQSFSRQLCADLNELFTKEAMFRLLYEGCEIDFFEDNPHTIRFSLTFKTEQSNLLENVVKETLENSRPHFTMPENEVMLVGGMFFILKDVYLSKSVQTLFTTMYVTETIRKTTLPTPILSTSSHSEVFKYDATNVLLTYEVYNMTDWDDLMVKDSALFKFYRNRACADLNKIFKNSDGALGLTYKDCDIERFRKSPLSTTLKLTFSQMMSDRLKVLSKEKLESRSPQKITDGHFLIKVGDMWLIVDQFEMSQEPTNFTSPSLTEIIKPTKIVTSTKYVSSSKIIFQSLSSLEESITTTLQMVTEQPLLYDAVLANVTYLLYNFNFTEDHKNPNSLTFRLEEQRFCNDIDKVYRDVFQSPFVFTYKECRVESFQQNPNTVQFHLIFGESMRNELKSIIPSVLQRLAPKSNISEYEVMDLGKLHLVIGQYIITVTHHNYTERVTIPIKTTPKPTHSTSTTIEQTSTTSTTVKPSPTEATIIFPTEWVKMQFNANLWNFTWQPELLDPNSPMFRELELAFCNDISKFFSNSMMYTAYRGCMIDSFTTNPEEINFKIGFVSPLYTGLGTDIVTIIEENAPRTMVQDDFTLTAVMDIGGMYLVWKNFTFYIVSPGGLTSYWIPPSTVTLPTTTSEPTYLLKLSFQVLNRTYDRALADKNSAEFKRQESLFCGQISEMLVTHSFKFPDYSKCEVDAFVDNPLRVNFSLAFRGQQPEEMKSRVIGMIIEGSPRVNFNDLFALLIGDLTLALQGFTTHIHNHSSIDNFVTPPSFDYDGLLYNYTFYLYDGNWTQQLTNPNSKLFQETVNRFCEDISGFFKRHALARRYVACDVEKFGNLYNKDMIVHVVLDGTVDVGGQLVYDVIYQSAPFQVIDGIGWLQIGNLLVYANTTGSVGYIRFLEAPTQPPLPMTTPPQINTFLHISFNVLNLTYSSQLGDSNSALFKAYAMPFCSYLDQIFSERNRFPNYDGCTVENFSNNPVSVKFNLRFIGAQPENLQDLITGMLIEKAPRTVINNQIALVVGNLGIFESSLAVARRTVTGSPFTIPGDITTQFPFPNLPLIPNQQVTRGPTSACRGTNSIFVPHPTNCEKFYMCTDEQGVEIQCADGNRFDPNLSACVTKTPGFTCSL